jgi:hypothetical protein
MHPEEWRSRTGAPWPYLSEYEQGCTYEHVGYHLTWLCAIFGPVDTVTSFSKRTLPDKTNLPFHRMRIIGNKGMLSVNTYRHYQCPVHLEKFSQLTLNARKARSVRNNTLLQQIFGVGGRKIKLVQNPPPGYRDRTHIAKTKWWSPPHVLKKLVQNEIGQQDKCIGIAELADALSAKRACFPPHDFTLHLTELTIAIQSAGVRSATHVMQTNFKPLVPPQGTPNFRIDHGATRSQSLLDRAVERILIRMHKH